MKEDDLDLKELNEREEPEKDGSGNPRIRFENNR